MIKKVFQINKETLNKENYLLFYGINEGSKDIKTSEILLNKKKDEIFNFEEKDILNNEDIFFDEILNKSLFTEEKIIIIKKGTDKILNLLKKIINKKLNDLKIIVISGVLEKKSKLRNFFEKENNLICVPFYQDTYETLLDYAKNFFLKNNITISSSNINLIINRCNGDKKILINELNKIQMFFLNKKKISTTDLIKLINLIENYSINELVDNCLAKNKNKTIQILNENNFDTQENIIIIRTFLIKSKRLLKLCIDYEKNKNLDLAVNNSKPPIFWKDKDIIKQQISKWKSQNIKKLIYKLGDIELEIKKKLDSSIIIITDFINDLVINKANN